MRFCGIFPINDIFWLRFFLFSKQKETIMVLITKLTRALGIRHPVVQGGMHHVGFVVLLEESLKKF